MSPCRRRVESALCSLFLLSLCAARAAPPAVRNLSVAGLVLGADERPLPGATVALYAIPTRWELAERQLAVEGHGDPLAEVSPGPDGRFRLQAPEPGFYFVVARADGRVPSEQRLTPLLGDLELETVHLLSDDGLTVTVVDGAGKPVAGARVAFQGFGPQGVPEHLRPASWRPPAWRMARTGPRGQATLPRFRGEVGWVQVTAPGGTGKTNLRPGVPGGRVEVALEPVAVRQIRVVGKDGEPVAGAVAWSGALTAVGMTGDDGRLEIPLPGNRAAPAYIDAPGGLGAQVEVEPATEDRPGPQVVTLRPLAEVAGRVVEAEGGAGIPGALVWSTVDPATSVTSGRGGAFRVTVPGLTGPGEIGAAAPGYLAAGVQAIGVSGKPVEDPVLELRPAATLSGRVVDGTGRPVSLAAVQVSSAVTGPLGRRFPTARHQARTDRGGRFRIDGLPVDDMLSVRATHEGFAPWEDRVDPVAAPGAGPEAHRKGFPEIEIVLSQGGRVVGRLVDEDGVPVVTAEVTLAPQRPRQGQWMRDPEPSRTVESGPDGGFDFVDLAVGRVDLGFSASGFAPAIRTGVEVARLGETVDVGDVVLGPEAVLEGVVEDPRGVPIEGAGVRVNPAGSGLGRLHPAGIMGTTETSGPDGTFRIAGLSPGDRIDLLVSKEGFAPVARSGVGVPTQEPVRLVLEPAARVAGRVVDESGTGVEDAALQPTSESDPMMGWALGPGRQASGAGGSFDVEVPPGAIHLNARKRGYRAVGSVLLELEPGERRDGVEIVLAKAPKVRGRVLTPDGAPAAEAMVMVSVFGPMGGGAGQGMTTDADGRFEIEAAPGRVRVEASKEGFAAAERNLELTGDSAVVELRLGRGTEVSGRLVDASGEPAPGRQLVLTDPMSMSPSRYLAESAADGSFAFEGIGPGGYRLQVAPDPTGRGGSGYLYPETIEVGAGSPLSGLLIRLPGGVTLRGRLLGVEPSEIAGTSVVARGGEAGRPRSVSGTVLDGGRFEIDDLEAGVWEVSAAVSPGGKRGQATVEIGPGQTLASLDVELTEELTVTGTVLWNGEPAVGVRVVSGQGWWGSGGPATDADGRFELSGLKPGRQQLTLLAPNRGVRIVRTVEVAGGDDLLFDIETARVSGTVLSSNGMAPVAGANVALSPDSGESGPFHRRARTSTAVDGAFVLQNVELGRYKLRVVKEGYGTLSVPLEVLEGGVTAPPVVLDPAGALVVHVRRADGGSSPRGWVRATGADGAPVLESVRTWGASGTFEIDTLGPGRYEVSIETSDGLVGRASAVVPGPPVVVVVGPPEDAEPR